MSTKACPRPDGPPSNEHKGICNNPFSSHRRTRRTGPGTIWRRSSARRFPRANSVEEAGTGGGSDIGCRRWSLWSQCEENEWVKLMLASQIFRCMFCSNKKMCRLYKNVQQYWRSAYISITSVGMLFIHIQGGWGVWPTGNGKKLSNSQACCLAQLCLAAA